MDSGLANLRVLFLNHNQLSGPIPPELGNLANLWELSLNDNQLTGCIPSGLQYVQRNDFDSLGLPFCASTLTPGVEADRDALVALYNAAGGENWPHNANWLSDRPISQWQGVTTDYSGRITWLALSYNRLVGEIPPELGNLANLKKLTLHHNQLRGGIPPKIGNLSNLRELTLNHNQLSGPVPPELGKLGNLEYLDLARNQLTEKLPAELGRLSNLRTLWLSGNQLTGPIPPELGELANLGYLDLTGNQLTGKIPAELGRLSNLRTLRLSGNQLSGTLSRELTNLADLRSFTFYNNPGLCAPGDDEFQAWLRTVEGEGSSCAPDNSPEDMAVLVALYNATGGANWANSTNWLSDRPISDWRGVITDADGRVIRLLLRLNYLTGEIPPELGNLANLVYLDLSGSGLTGKIPPELGNLANLVQLDLSFNELTSAIPPELGNLSNLRWLALGNNRLTGSIPPELGNLAREVSSKSV